MNLESKENSAIIEILGNLEKLLEISIVPPKNPDGTDKILSSRDIANGEPDNWVRKGKFTSASGYLQMLKVFEVITDDSLSTRIDNFRDFLKGDDFKSKNKTTPEEISMAITLIKDVLNHLKG